MIKWSAMKKSISAREALLAMFLLISVANVGSILAAQAKGQTAEAERLQGLAGIASVGISPAESVSFQ